MSKGRLIYIAVIACLVGAALLSALAFLPSGMHDGADL